MSIVRNFNLYLNAGNGSVPYINVNQYDQGEQWVFTLYKEDGTKYLPSTGAIIGIKADNRGIINTGTVDADGRVVINETQQMTAAAGIAIFELLIDGNSHGTANFLVNVEQRPGDNADLSDSDLSLIQQAVDAAEEIKAVIEKMDITIDTYNDLTPMEKKIALDFAQAKTGEVFCTKTWKFASNTSSVGEKMLDSVGKTAEPATHKTAGEDDFLNYLPFQWRRCNYVRESDGFARLIALEAAPNYRTFGAVDVGIISATFFWKHESYETYDLWYMSDSPHPELGLVPWCDALRADGTLMPYYIVSAYPSVVASDGLLRSQPGKSVAYDHSYNNMITNYQRKGTGYWGAGLSRTALGYLFFMIKYANKSSQTKFAGCTSYDFNVDVAASESDVKRVLIAASENSFVENSCVMVSTTVRGGTIMADRVRIESIETVEVDGTTYKALNLEIDEPISPTAGLKVATMPNFSGQTDDVIGRFDGSYESNTDGKHTYRIHGMEFNWGQWIPASDAVIEYIEDNTRRSLFVAPRGVAHVANAHTNYIEVGEFAEGTSDAWIGDITIDEQTGAMYPVADGTGSNVGCGDRFYRNAGTAGTLRECLQVGSLLYGLSSGLCAVHSSYALGPSLWTCGSCD